MAVLYRTVAKEAVAEQIIEKSRFIAHIKSVSSKEEADAFISSVRARYRDASHNVPAMVIGDKMQLQWGSDDGEPQGTSGAPVVQMLVKEGITNVAVVITRYFGGIKLGTGGLVRAYTGCAKLALEEAGILEVKEFVQKVLDIPYGLYDTITWLSRNEPFRIISTEFTDKVKIVIEYEKDDQDLIVSMLQSQLKNFE